MMGLKSTPKNMWGHIQEIEGSDNWFSRKHLGAYFLLKMINPLWAMQEIRGEKRKTSKK